MIAGPGALFKQERRVGDFFACSLRFHRRDRGRTGLRKGAEATGAGALFGNEGSHWKGLLPCSVRFDGAGWDRELRWLLLSSSVSVYWRSGYRPLFSGPLSLDRVGERSW